MTLRDATHLLRKLNPHMTAALEAAVNFCQARMQGEVALEHWLLKLIEHGDGDVPIVLHHYRIDIDAVWEALLAAIDRFPRDLRGKPALSRALADALQDAWLLASRDESPSIRSAHLMAALVESPHWLRATDAWSLLSISAAQIRRLMPVLDRQSVESMTDDVIDSAAIGEKSVDEDAPASREPVSTVASRSAKEEALARFAIDLTAKARDGKIDPVFGRDREIAQMVDVLGRRRKNNPILVGEPGVGKTALVEGLALCVAEGSVPASLRDVRILTLDLGLLQAGAGVKGEFEQRLKNVIDEVQRSVTPVLLFIDEAHTLIGAGNSAGGADAANLLKPALARGELRTIAATTWSEYKEYFERDAALERRFQLIKVDEPDDATACLMMRGLVDRYAAYHDVRILDEALVAAVKLSRRYIPGRQLPDKAVDLIDTAAARVRKALESPPVELQCARAEVVALERELEVVEYDRKAGVAVPDTRLHTIEAQLAAARTASNALQTCYDQALSEVAAFHDQRDGDANATPSTLAVARQSLMLAQGKSPVISPDVDAAAIARVVAEWTGVPVGDLVEDELIGLLALESRLTDRVVGQGDALAVLAQSLRTARAGLKNEHSPLGVFLLVGPSGVGKTETALALADTLFGGEASLTTINMSEYQEGHTVSQLKGSPPGYVGYGRGGVLTEAVRQRPYSVILLDEVEKAHRDVLEIFYQVFDRGSMRDGEGREVDFRNSVILMTSNLGAEQIMDQVDTDPDISSEALLADIRPILTDHFQAALLARFQPIVYRPLDAEALTAIVRMKLMHVGERLRRQHGIALHCEDVLLATLAQACLIRESGARNVDGLLNTQVLPVLAREILLRMQGGEVLGEICLGLSESGGLAIDFVSRACALDVNVTAVEA
ncbi:type VI secretion system ATPase TssH [Dyella caseinilytica]|uniref:Type VI secretion system ATPase TssH n=1 Tax=Dyella caseinilytica TaxID=1849581 RepID=A0ABX7GYL2_9GAMM|nr:type VI secretion system ATPase TssH [Dyella caseinilytica]QRN55038.1 type VI secretion system ATPase TssH [Dyella caseinilytica]GFZ98872.1 ClpV1 family T6SS ATPase [Dyella caseinilytica]